MARRTPPLAAGRPSHPASQCGVTTGERLLRATMQLIPELGWSAVTTRKVASRAGVQPGVVHYHFASVSDLLVEAAVQFSREALAAPMAALRAAPDPASGLDRLLAAVDAFADDDDTALLLTESVLAATRDDQMRRRLRALLTDFRSEVAAWLHRHGNEADADATAAVLAAALDGQLLHRAVDAHRRASWPAAAPAEHDGTSELKATPDEGDHLRSRYRRPEPWPGGCPNSARRL